MFLLRAVPGRAPWLKTRPPDVRLRAPSLGLAPGGGPGDPRPGKGNSEPFSKIIMSRRFGYSLSGPSPRTCLPWVTLPGGIKPPDNIASRVIGPRKPLHHGKVVASEEWVDDVLD